MMPAVAGVVASVIPLGPPKHDVKQINTFTLTIQAKVIMIYRSLPWCRSTASDMLIRLNLIKQAHRRLQGLPWGRGGGRNTA